MASTLRDIYDRVEIQDDGCHEWQGALFDNRYGCVWWQGKSRRVHRVVWELTRGECPQGLEPDHLCENTRCCNPIHIEWVTPVENKRRQAERKQACIHGHPRTKEHVRVNSRGAKFCWTCKIVQQRARRTAA